MRSLNRRSNGRRLEFGDVGTIATVGLREQESVRQVTRLARVLTSSGVILALAGTLLLQVAAAEPRLTVSSPSDGATIQGDTVTVEFEVADFQVVPSTVPVSEAGQRTEANRPGEGHLHFMLDAGSLVVWERDEPYTFTNVPTGEHVLMVELVNNDHSSLSPPVVMQIQFRTVSGATLPNTGGGGEGGQVTATGVAILFGFACVLIVAGQLIRRRMTLSN